jgi:Flp pilus assembly pilin Flp
MPPFLAKAGNFGRQQAGASSLEYAVLVALIAAVIISVVQLLGLNLISWFTLPSF